MANIGIIGWGVVGKATGETFSKNPANSVFWFDKNIKGKFTLYEVVENSDFIFICVPTPMFWDEKGIDLSIVKKVIREIVPKVVNTRKILIIKSTVIPGTTLELAKKYKGIRWAMTPEFLTEINAKWDSLHPDRIVIGCVNEADGIEIAKLHRSVFDHEVKIFVTDTTTAEMVKYMSNTFMAVKIIFANEMKELSENFKINYDDVRKMVALDPRIGESFLGVTPFKGFGGKCFPKDTVALLGVAKKMKVDLSILEAAWKKNLKIRKIKDWEIIDGAVSSRKT